MRKVLLVALLLLPPAGCAFNRADFVCGPNGLPREEDLSSSGRAVGNFFQNGLKLPVLTY
ncbi:MAG TPA: hypothetical protein VFA26_25775 [Gemmataceae bacterium]|nr:hypothetical protein [Gemmataceae bacterium]